MTGENTRYPTFPSVGLLVSVLPAMKVVTKEVHFLGDTGKEIIAVIIYLLEM